MKNTQRGSAILWVIIAIIILGAGGYFYYSNSQPKINGVVIDRSSTTAKIPGQSDSNSVPASTMSSQSQTSSGNVSSFSCDNVFPLNLLQKSFPTFQFTPRADNGSRGVGFFCDYDSAKNPSLPGYDANIEMYQPGIAVYSVTDESYDLTLSTAQKMGETCTSSVVGSKSSECVDNQVDSILFISTNNKYIVLVSLTTMDSTYKKVGVVEQMAKEIDSKLSSI